MLTEQIKFCTHLMLTVFGIFLLISHSNSNIKGKTGPIVLQTCLCHDKVFEVNVFRLFQFYFCSYENGVAKLSLI